MRFLRNNVLTLGLGLWLATPVGVLAGQPAQDTTEDTVRSTLILGLRPVTVVFTPSLEADEPRHRGLLSSSGQTSDRVRVARLDSHPLLRIGSLDGSELTEETAEDETPSRRRPPRYDLWLTRADTGGWVLEAQRAETDEPVSADIVGTIPLSRDDAPNRARTLSVALVPTGDDAGQLALTWGNHRWTADFGFADPPENRGRQQGGADGVRQFDSDTSAISRAVTLAERHETQIRLSDDSRISILFWKEVASDHDDFAAIATLGDTNVIRLTEAAVTRLRTEVPLQFGQVTVPTDNLAPGFPGSYGLWLKRVGPGWRLVFNNEADSWGTQHDAAHDAAEIDLTHSQDGAAERPLGVALVPTGARGGQVVIHWGPHEWTADFTVGS